MRYIEWIKNIATVRVASSRLSSVAGHRNPANNRNAFNNAFRLISCFRYDLEIDSLYSISWYKDNEEFYKYIARAEVNRHTHPITGVKIDVSWTAISAHFPLTLRRVPVLFPWEWGSRKNRKRGTRRSMKRWRSAGPGRRTRVQFDGGWNILTQQRISRDPDLRSR